MQEVEPRRATCKDTGSQGNAGSGCRNNGRGAVAGAVAGTAVEEQLPRAATELPKYPIYRLGVTAAEEYGPTTPLPASVPSPCRFAGRNDRASFPYA